MFKAYLTLAACLLPVFAAHAADASPPQTVAVAASGPASAPAAPAMICHRETPTGSTIPVKVCRPADVPGDAAANERIQQQIQHDAAMQQQQRLNSH